MPGFLAAMDAPRRNLTLALGISLLLHGVLLAVRFTPPDFVDRARERALEVILVNSKSKSQTRARHRPRRRPTSMAAAIPRKTAAPRHRYRLPPIPAKATSW
jgi:hypothetical protein